MSKRVIKFSARTGNVSDPHSASKKITAELLTRIERDVCSIPAKWKVIPAKWRVIMDRLSEHCIGHFCQGSVSCHVEEVDYEQSRWIIFIFRQRMNIMGKRFKCPQLNAKNCGEWLASRLNMIDCSQDINCNPDQDVCQTCTFQCLLFHHTLKQWLGDDYHHFLERLVVDI